VIVTKQGDDYTHPSATIQIIIGKLLFFRQMPRTRRATGEHGSLQS